MAASFVPSASDYLRILPEIIMTVAGTLIMLIGPVLEKKKSGCSILTLGAFVAALASAGGANNNPGVSFSNMLIVDGFATFFRVLVIGVGILTVLSSSQYLRREHAEAGEYYALLLFSVTGPFVMATANELIMIFIGLEISSISTYVLAGYFPGRQPHKRATTKHFLLGPVRSALLAC